MASSSGRKRTTSGRKTTKKSNNSSTRRNTAQRSTQDSAMFHEIGLIVLFLAMVFLFFCNFGIIGPVGNAISGFLFGLFGLTAYVAPILLFLAIAFWLANEGNGDALRKLLSGIVLFLMLGVLCELFADNIMIMGKYSAKTIYEYCKVNKKGGGILAGTVAYLLHHNLETIGTVLVVILLSAISIILLTEKSLLDGVKNSGEKLREISREEKERRIENNQLRRREQDELRARREEERLIREEQRKAREEEQRRKEEERRLKEEEKENEKILRMEKKVSGVMPDTSIKQKKQDSKKSNMHEITLEENEFDESSVAKDDIAFNFDNIRVRSAHSVNLNNVMQNEEPAYEEEVVYEEEPVYEEPLPVAKPAMREVTFQEEPARPVEHRPVSVPASDDLLTENIKIHKEDIEEPEPVAVKRDSRPVAKLPESPTGGDAVADGVIKEMHNNEKTVPKTYMFPPLSRLQKGKASNADTTAELKDTALRLQQTLTTFGVKATITDISQGPTVTRYELQPEQGVKVSKIVNLADDIKLNLAATDIRIEAPIPGKAAIGIEVPNKENTMVAFRDLLESKEFKEFPSNIAFAVGKDIAGKIVVTDIGKMPHLLIAGSTGSGKSVCINTIIMSILYKAHPDDVKLIMVDPKVVELSVYNGIPHLLIPVVTDCKKAAAALHWAVSEMEDRYRKFADQNVRDLKGYNQKMEELKEHGDEAAKKLPQIVIIVDELAELMMANAGDVEASICRLAQLARACGIHLIIATQRPSVDVITGLIKNNLPSRIAFAVKQQVDSRTILDMGGAERLLGKGDMLFYPQGYPKPARIQGAFISDSEVYDVVDFLKNQTIGNVYSSDVEAQISSMGSSGGASSGGGGGEDARDELFAEAGRLVIDKNKASIGSLQRHFRIGFNRAARIVDQLCDYGVVGAEEGTKPRNILMSPEQFEQLLEEI